MKEEIKLTCIDIENDAENRDLLRRFAKEIKSDQSHFEYNPNAKPATGCKVVHYKITIEDINITDSTFAGK